MRFEANHYGWITFEVFSIYIIVPRGVCVYDCVLCVCVYGSSWRCPQRARVPVSAGNWMRPEQRSSDESWSPLFWSRPDVARISACEVAYIDLISSSYESAINRNGGREQVITVNCVCVCFAPHNLRCGTPAEWINSISQLWAIRVTWIIMHSEWSTRFISSTHLVSGHEPLFHWR